MRRGSCPPRAIFGSVVAASSEEMPTVSDADSPIYKYVNIDQYKTHLQPLYTEPMRSRASRHRRRPKHTFDLPNIH